MKTRSNSSSSSSSCCSVVVCNVYDWWNTVQRELEETVHRMELENTRLDMALQHERDKSKQLNRECTDARQVCDMRRLNRMNSCWDLGQDFDLVNQGLSIHWCPPPFRLLMTNAVCSELPCRCSTSSYYTTPLCLQSFSLSSSSHVFSFRNSIKT